MSYRTLTFFSILFHLSQYCFSQWTSDSTVNTIVRDQSGISAVTPLSVTTSEGKTYVSWFESSAGTYVMKMQLLDPEGNKLWDTDGLLISDHPQQSALYVYDLAVDHDDNAIVAFQDIRNIDLQVVAYKIDQSGNFIWGPDGIVLHDSPADFELAPSIGILSDNDLFIAWTATFSNLKWIAFMKIAADGSLPGSVLAISSGSSSPDYSRPDFAPQSDGSFIMSYVKETGNFPALTSTVMANRFNADGIALWPNQVTVSSYSISFVAYPFIETDPNGGALICFGSGTIGNPFLGDVFLQRIDENGVTLYGDDGKPVCVLSGQNKFPAGIDYLESADETAVLLKVLDGSQGMSGAYVQIMNGSGDPTLGADGKEVLPLSSTNYHEPFGWSNTGSGFIILYTEGGVISQVLKAIAIDYNGNTTWSFGTVVLSEVNSNKYDATIGDFHNNQSVAVWYDERNDGGVYAQNVNGDGSLGLSATGFSSLNMNPKRAIIAPNPVQDLLSVTTAAAQHTIFTIIDQMGTTLYGNSFETSHASIDVSILTEGSYFLKLRMDAEVITLPFIVQRR